MSNDTNGVIQLECINDNNLINNNNMINNNNNNNNTSNNTMQTSNGHFMFNGQLFNNSNKKYNTQNEKYYDLNKKYYRWYNRAIYGIILLIGFLTLFFLGFTYYAYQKQCNDIELFETKFIYLEQQIEHLKRIVHHQVKISSTTTRNLPMDEQIENLKQLVPQHVEMSSITTRNFSSDQQNEYFKQMVQQQSIKISTTTRSFPSDKQSEYLKQMVQQQQNAKISSNSKPTRNFPSSELHDPEVEEFKIIAVNVEQYPDIEGIDEENLPPAVGGEDDDYNNYSDEFQQKENTQASGIENNRKFYIPESDTNLDNDGKLNKFIKKNDGVKDKKKVIIPSDQKVNSTNYDGKIRTDNLQRDSVEINLKKLYETFNNTNSILNEKSNKSSTISIENEFEKLKKVNITENEQTNETGTIARRVKRSPASTLHNKGINYHLESEVTTTKPMTKRSDEYFEEDDQIKRNRSFRATRGDCKPAKNKKKQSRNLDIEFMEKKNCNEVSSDITTNIGPENKLMAAHFGGNSSKVKPHPSYKGNDRVIHNTREHIMHWSPSSWFTDLNMDEYFKLEDGTLKINYEGLYFFYSQIFYHETHDANGYIVYKNSKEIFHCINEGNTSGQQRANTCYTGGLVYCKENDIIFIKTAQEGREVILSPSSSFFGMFLLTDKSKADIEQF